MIDRRGGQARQAPTTMCFVVYETTDAVSFERSLGLATDFAAVMFDGSAFLASTRDRQ